MTKKLKKKKHPNIKIQNKEEIKVKKDQKFLG